MNRERKHRTLALLGGASALGWISISTSFGLPYAQCAIVIGYAAALASTYRNDPVNLNKMTDSIYFLGFFFTLLAIVESLSIFDSEKQFLEGLSNFVANMGIALWTTVTGILLRSVIKYSRGYDLKVDTDTREEEHLKALEQAYDQFVNSHELMMKGADEFYKARRTDVERAAKEIESHLEIAETFKERYSTIHKEMDRLAKGIVKLRHEFETIKIGVSKNGNGLAAELTRAATSSRNLKGQLSSTQRSLEMVSQTAERLGDQLGDINSKMEANKNLSETLDKTLEEFMDLIRNKVLALSQVESDVVSAEINKSFQELNSQVAATVCHMKGVLSQHTRSSNPDL